MIITPFTGSAACLDQSLAYLIDGNTGNVTTHVLATEAVIPVEPENWKYWSKSAARLTKIGSVTPGVSDNRAMQVLFPAQSSSPGDTYAGDTPETAALAGTARPLGGHNFMQPIPRSDHARLRYAVRFPVGFDWHIGGKLPGLASISWAASGGETDPEIAGVISWTARMMWRPAGQVTPYYYMADNRDARWNGSAYGGANPTYTGSTLFCDYHVFTPNQWDIIDQEIWMNTPGVADGGSVLKINDVVVASRSDILWRQNSNLHIDAVFISTFFGGSTAVSGDAANVQTTADVSVDFSDFVVTVLS